MDRFYSNGSRHDPRNLKLKGLSTSSNRDSALIKYLRSGSSSGDATTSPARKFKSGSDVIRSPVLGPPLKVEEDEDVLVMDAILVSGGRSAARSVSGSSGKSVNKFAHGQEELCPGQFLQKNKPEFAHGKGQLSPSRFLDENKSEVHIENINSTSYSSKSHPAAIPYGPARAATVAMKLEAQDKDTIVRNWSPFDDGIGIGMPVPMPMSASSSDHTPSSREDLDALIVSVFDGPSTKKRLPVFVGICPE